MEGDVRGIRSDGALWPWVHRVTQDISELISIAWKMGKTVLITGANRGYVPALQAETWLLTIRVGLELTKAYLEKGWKVIAAVRDPSKMDIKGDVMVVKLEVGEKEDAKKVRSLSIFFFLYSLPNGIVVGSTGS